MPNDLFEKFTPGLQSPAVMIETVVPDDAGELQYATRAINVAGSGSVRVRTVDNIDADVFVAAGIAFPIRVKQVYATGTTATGIRGLS